MAQRWVAVPVFIEYYLSAKNILHGAANSRLKLKFRLEILTKEIRRGKKKGWMTRIANETAEK